MNAEAFAIVDGDPMPVELGHAVGAARMEPRALVLDGFGDIAEHLAARRLVEPGFAIDDPYRFEHGGNGHPRHLRGQ